MASPAEIAQGLPDTLPDDFVEWDGEGAAATEVADSAPALPAIDSGNAAIPAVKFAEAKTAEPTQGASRAEAAAIAPAPEPQPVTPKLDLQPASPRPETAQPGMEAALAAAIDPPPATRSQEPRPRLSRPDSRSDEDSFHGGLKALDAAWKNHNGAALRQPPAPEIGAGNKADSTVEKVDPLGPARPGAAAVDASRTTPPALQSQAAADEEAFFRQLRAIGNVLNSQPIRASHRPAPPPPPLEAITSELESSRESESTAKSTLGLRLSNNPIRITANVAADTGGVPSFMSDLADAGGSSAGRKKWITIGSIGGVALLALVFILVRMLSSGKPTLAKQTTAPQAAPAPLSSAVKPSPSTPLPSSRELAASDASLATAAGQPAAATAAQSQPAGVDAQAMNDQLAAARKIQQGDLKTREDAPPPSGFNSAGIDGATDANSIGGVFNQKPGPTVTYVPYDVVTIAPAVANGLVLQKTAPVFPANAWYSYANGKVLLQVKVSRTGTVETASYLSGPREFRQAALDAVKSWRYKPYLVDNIAREFQTTVEVTFTQNTTKNPMSLLHVGPHSKKTASTAPKITTVGAV